MQVNTGSRQGARMIKKVEGEPESGSPFFYPERPAGRSHLMQRNNIL
jgi:hypothetical protein